MPAACARSAPLPVKTFLRSETRRWAKLLWVLVPSLAFVFACFVGRDWPFHIGPNFPKAGQTFTAPTATSAAFVVYSPDARTTHLATEIQVAEPAKLPLLQVSINHDNAVETSAVATEATGGDHLIAAKAPLRLGRGFNVITLGLGAAGAAPITFSVRSIRHTQGIFEPGNLLFCLTLSCVVAGAILVARAIGAGGLHLFCAASLIGFLLVTSTATLLSPFHLLTGAAWAVSLIALSAILGTVSVLRLARHPPVEPALENTVRPLEAIVLLALVCPVFVMHILSPLTRWDDLMYHGPRTGYWMQNASALPFVSHNDRLAVFPIGGDLLFACGTIIPGSEFPGKFLVGLSFPLTLFALLALLKSAGVRSTVALGVIAIFATTPVVMSNAVGIKPDVWLVLLVVITLHWVLAARRGDAGASPAILACLAAISAGAAFGVKWTAAPLLLLLPFALLRPGWRERPVAHFLPATMAFFLALALGGAGPNLLFNLWTSHHPLGPRAMRVSQQPDPGLQAPLVQLARLPFVMFPPPYVANERLRTAIESWEGAVADAVGATVPLRGENELHGFGRFVPHVNNLVEGYSFAWVFVAAGVIAGITVFRRNADSAQRADVLIVSGFSLIFILVMSTQTRWQVRAGLPDRFLLPALATGLVVFAFAAGRLVTRSKLIAALLTVLLVLHAAPYGYLFPMPFRLGAGNGWRVSTSPENGSDLNGISRWLPPRRTILLFADQSCQEYPLFLPREGFANRVLPWGKAAYEPAAFDRALHQPGVDTVMLVAPDEINLLWDPPLDARPFVADMNARADFRRVPGTGNLVVYLRKD